MNLIEQDDRTAQLERMARPALFNRLLALNFDYTVIWSWNRYSMIAAIIEQEFPVSETRMEPLLHRYDQGWRDLLFDVFSAGMDAPEYTDDPALRMALKSQAAQKILESPVLVANTSVITSSSKGSAQMADQLSPVKRGKLQKGDKTTLAILNMKALRSGLRDLVTKLASGRYENNEQIITISANKKSIDVELRITCTDDGFIESYRVLKLGKADNGQQYSRHTLYDYIRENLRLS